MIGITGVVIGTTGELKDVSDPSVRLRMHLQTLLGDVVGRNRREPHAGDLVGLAGCDRHDIAREIDCNVVRCDDLRSRGGQPGDLLGLQMVGVRVRDEDEIGRGRIVIGSPGIDVDRPVSVGEAE